METDSKKPLLAIDLFSGAGGFSEGLEASGIRVALSQELHPQPALTLAFNHPDTSVVVGDIRSLDLDIMEEMISKRYPGQEIDVVVGGPPCQGFSTAGKKNENDPRNGLFKNFCNVVSYFKPKVVILENVTGFKKMYDGRIYEEAIDSFSALGYKVVDSILNAVDYGVPQRRKRFIMVGVREDIKLKFEWPKPTHQNPEVEADIFGPRLKKHVSVEEAISDLGFVKPGYEAHAHKLGALSDYQVARRGNYQRLFNHLATKHREKAELTFSYIPEGGTIGNVPDEYKSAKKTMARLDRRHISNTVLALPDDLIHYAQHRIPTVREMARLQSFDDDYVFIGKRTSGFTDRKHDVPQYTQVGNAVPPLLARAIGFQVVELLGADHVDIRSKIVRRNRHKWLRGSSGFTGYALDSVSSISLYDTHGRSISLPIDDAQPKTLGLPDLVNWKAAGKTGAKRQWAPGVNEVVNVYSESSCTQNILA
ncbi:DNA cytosine methyltransferase [Pseudomonas sp. JDS08PS003]|uniref:DNA cytosine methyltransferase n=1 Tax=Pseudomonas sp. JDS08PS003 TaxID=2497162 RepID=UPI0038574E5F